MTCRALNGALGGWYMRSYSNNLLFIVVLLTTLKVHHDCSPEISEQAAMRGA